MNKQVGWITGLSDLVGINRFVCIVTCLLHFYFICGFLHHYLRSVPAFCRLLRAAARTARFVLWFFMLLPFGSRFLFLVLTTLWFTFWFSSVRYRPPFCRAQRSPLHASRSLHVRGSFYYYAPRAAHAATTTLPTALRTVAFARACLPHTALPPHLYWFAHARSFVLYLCFGCTVHHYALRCRGSCHCCRTLRARYRALRAQRFFRFFAFFHALPRVRSCVTGSFFAAHSSFVPARTPLRSLYLPYHALRAHALRLHDAFITPFGSYRARLWLLAPHFAAVPAFTALCRFLPFAAAAARAYHRHRRTRFLAPPACARSAVYGSFFTYAGSFAFRFACAHALPPFAALPPPRFFVTVRTPATTLYFGSGSPASSVPTTLYVLHTPQFTYPLPTGSSFWLLRLPAAYYRLLPYLPPLPFSTAPYAILPFTTTAHALPGSLYL